MVKEARGSGGGSSNGGAGEVKKGPWTTTEDEVLLEYVRRHGEGNWNSVQRNSGLQRCGKSCRLRWANHLRPHLKKGPFTPQEERIIIDLHSKLGNKWARMAAQLPGRTDNEIKNYWNTRLKRRQRAGLPLYPHGILQQQQHHHQPTVLPTISTSHSLASILSAGSSSFHHHHRTATTHLNSPASTLSFLNYPPYRNNINPTNNGLSGLSFSNPQVNTPKMSLFNQSLSRNSLPFDALVFNNSDLAAATRATSFDRVGLFQMGSGTNTGFSPIAPQTPVPPAAPTTQTSSGYTGTDGMFGGASNEYDQITSSGLLGDLLEESQVIKSGESSNGKIISADHVLMENDSSGYTGCDGMFGGASTEYDQIASSGLLEDLLEESQVIKSGESSNGKIISEDHGLMENDFEVFGVDNGHGHGNFISAHSDTGTMNAEKEVTEDMNEVDDELLRLLDCPSPGPISDWYDFGSSSNVNSNVADDGPAVITESYDQTSLAGPTTSETVNHTLGNDSCCWKYMPGALYKLH